MATAQVLPSHFPSTRRFASTSAQLPPRATLFLTLPLASAAPVFRPFIAALSAHLTLRCVLSPSPLLASCCELFRRAGRSGAFLVVAASSGSSHSARLDVNQRVEQVKATHRDCLLVLLGQLGKKPQLATHAHIASHRLAPPHTQHLHHRCAPCAADW